MKRKKALRFLAPEDRVQQQIRKIAWCRARVADEEQRLQKLIREQPHLADEFRITRCPTLAVDNTRPRRVRLKKPSTRPPAA